MPLHPLVMAHLVLGVIAVAVMVVTTFPTPPVVLVQLTAEREVEAERVGVTGLEEMQPQAAVEVEVDEAIQLIPVARATPERQQTIPLLIV
jgi:hypothetical protein